MSCFEGRRSANLPLKLNVSISCYYYRHVCPDLCSLNHSVLPMQVNYHLEMYDDSLRSALGAGIKFDISSNSEFVQTIVSSFHTLCKSDMDYRFSHICMFDSSMSFADSGSGVRTLAFVRRVISIEPRSGDGFHLRPRWVMDG